MCDFRVVLLDQRFRYRRQLKALDDSSLLAHLPVLAILRNAG
jgi:hypothetical protein